MSAASATIRVLVYGTLLRGQPNHRVLAGARFVREARTAPTFELYDLGYFPGLVAGGATGIAGELYDVDLATLERLDQLEGHPSFYRRRSISLDDGTLAQAYLLPRTSIANRPRIPSGSWLTHRTERS